MRAAEPLRAPRRRDQPGGVHGLHGRDGYHRVQKYDLSGNLLDTWGDLPWESPGGTFRNPYGIAVGKDGTVYVGDGSNHRVQHFARNGALLEAWGRLGTETEPGIFTSIP